MSALEFGGKDRVSSVYRTFIQKKIKRILETAFCILEFKLEWVPAAAAKSLQSCLILCNPTDGSPPGSPIPGILQAKTQEWVAISFSNA